MSAIPQDEWDTLRFELLAELAALALLDGEKSEYHDLVAAMTRVFDRPVPGYTVYSKLRSFKAGPWPLLRKVIAKSNAGVQVDIIALAETLRKSTALLQRIHDQRGEIDADALDIQIEVLQQLLSR